MAPTVPCKSFSILVFSSLAKDKLFVRVSFSASSLDRLSLDSAKLDLISSKVIFRYSISDLLFFFNSVTSLCQDCTSSTSCA